VACFKTLYNDIMVHHLVVTLNFLHLKFVSKSILNRVDFKKVTKGRLGVQMLSPDGL
jgi:hypothetical protein